ncbi:MAG TPA: hypothetical protein VMW18_17170 [Candidatus Binatia bacterium]|nr:hypothetical protein [Candidatus Binatia bacterium]
MSQSQASTMPRFSLKCMQVAIDLKLYPVVSMNIQDVLIGGAPDWIAAKQRIDFSFVIDLQGKERRLPTYGVVITNDARGLDIRYRPPTSQWRAILAKLLTEETGAR